MTEFVYITGGFQRTDGKPIETHDRAMLLSVITALREFGLIFTGRVGFEQEVIHAQIDRQGPEE